MFMLCLKLWIRDFKRVQSQWVIYMDKRVFFNGGRLLPAIGYIGMRGAKGYGFLAVFGLK